MDTSPPVNIRHHIRYNPLTGEFWRRLPSGKAIAGARADIAAPDGYRRIKFAGKDYSAHRLAWFFAKGEWPALAIDHRNLDKSDNRLANLRLATISQNGGNTRARRNGLKGITVHSCGKFQASVKKDGKSHYLGLFQTPEEAHAAYQRAAVELHGEFARTA